MAKDDDVHLLKFKSIGGISPPCGGEIDEMPPPLDVQNVHMYDFIGFNSIAPTFDFIVTILDSIKVKIQQLANI